MAKNTPTPEKLGNLIGNLITAAYSEGVAEANDDGHESAIVKTQAAAKALRDALAALLRDRDSAVRHGEELTAICRDHDVKRTVAEADRAYETEQKVRLAAVIAEAPHASYHDGDTDWYCAVYAGEDCDCWKSKAPTTLLAQRDARVLREAAEEITLGTAADWHSHGNAGIVANAEAEASSWLEARATKREAGL